jgi:hypothetical protein
MEFVMRSRFSLYLAGLLVFEALIVRGGAPRFPQRQGTLVLAAALQRQGAAGSRPGIIPRLGIQSPHRSTIAGMMPT